VDTYDRLYAGSVAVGTKAIFVPYEAEWGVGIFDVQKNSFQTVSTDSSTSNWAGGSVVGTKVYFAPFNNAGVGVFDVATNQFTTVVADNSYTNKRFDGATVGTKVIFAPYSGNDVGIFDAVTNSFSTSSFSTDQFRRRTTERFTGAAAVGTTVYFSPHKSPCIGIYDVSTNTFSDMPLPFWGTQTSFSWSNYYYDGAIAAGTMVVFTPYASDASYTNVGILYTDTNIFKTFSISSTTASTNAFSGSAFFEQLSAVTFAPSYSDKVSFFAILP